MHAVKDEAKSRLLDILDYWHKIEFFIPFDVQRQVLDNAEDWQSRWLERDSLERGPEPSWQATLPDDLILAGFELYIGLFDRSEIGTLCQEALSQEISEAQHFEDEARAELEGWTCFAKLDLNKDGEPVFDPVSISTTPWAMGQLSRHGLASLSHQAFQDARNTLARRLHDFMSTRTPAEDAQVHPLLAAEVLQLHAAFCEWAGYAPDDRHPIALLRVRTKKRRTGDGNTGGETGEAGAQEDVDGAAGPDEEDPAEVPIEILNSFFIKDIERAIETLHGGRLPLPLLRYLTPTPDDERVDLYTEPGRQSILEALHPSRLNPGHWLSKPEHAMSLMQQFAINRIRTDLAETGLFSVNGPPGTGKTTLLSDLVADVLVARAGVLAGLERPQDAFEEKTTIVFKGADRTARGVGRLRDSLTGFEMVVASTNNAAVENISRDLPKTRSLGPQWHDRGYLQPVAHKLAAQEKDGACQPFVREGDRPWGLIACALGRSKNRYLARQRLFFPPAGEVAEQQEHRRGSGKFLSLWEWADLAAEHALPFRQARERFDAARRTLDEALALRREYADLVASLSGLDEQAFMARARSTADEAERICEQAHVRVEQARGQSKRLEAELEERREEERLLGIEAPGFLDRLLRSQSARTHHAQVRANASAQRDLRQRLRANRQALDADAATLAQAEQRVVEAHSALSAAGAEWERRQGRKVDLSRQFASLDLEARQQDLEGHDAQIQGLWHDEALASLRSELFSAALTLHESWLAEVMARNGGGFRGNVVAIGELLKGNRPEREADVALIWQSLFMIVPVVSSTFASFASQFRDLGPESIGWLFVDEAGQSVPQAAVGALWRARRAVVVGDPRQIEPVFTLPATLITSLAEQSTSTADRAYSPDKVSAQTLADRSNRFGTFAQSDNDAVWIGSPLRVHRRCIDPMFTLANRIAYEERMIYGLDDRTCGDGPPFHQPSAWIDIAGRVDRKQVVPEQVDFVVQAVLTALRRNGELPKLYLISPFKAVKEKLHQALSRAEWLDANGTGIPRSERNAWLRDRVGTVHTFQGKEEEAVMLILGCDSSTQGAVAWASSRPNLLNVAATRAKRRFYIVGEHALWKNKRYFDQTRDGMPVVSREHFIQRIEDADTAPLTP